MEPSETEPKEREQRPPADETRPYQPIAPASDTHTPDAGDTRSPPAEPPRPPTYAPPRAPSEGYTRSTEPPPWRAHERPASSTSTDAPTTAVPRPVYPAAPSSPPAERIEQPVRSPGLGQPRPQQPPFAQQQPARAPAAPAAQPARPAAQPARPAVSVRRLRKGRLAIRKIDPWAVFKFSLVFYFCMLLIGLLGLGIIFATLKAFGVIENLEKLLRALEFDVAITGGVIFRWLFLIGIGGTFIASAITTFMAFLYNLIADVVGGIELLVTERES